MSVAVRRVAIIKPCCIGDAVMALPVIDSVQSALTSARIQVWTGLHSRPVFEGHPQIAQIETMPNVPRAGDVPNLVWRLRRERCDVLCLLDRSRLLTAVCRLVKPRHFAGIRRNDEAERHEIDSYLETLDTIGIEPEITAPSVRLPSDRLRIGALFAARMSRPYIVLHPGGAENPGASMYSKRWPADRWIDLTRWARQRDLGIALTGSPAEQELCRMIADRAGRYGIEIAAGRFDLMDSAALIKNALAYVGPDTGMSHLSAATGVPTVVLFGPTNPDRYAPRGRTVVIVATAASRALPRSDLRRTGQVDPATAMTNIRLDDVLEAVEGLLTSPVTPCG